MASHSKPTLGYILKGYPRISETFISNEILLLERLGFAITIFPMRHPREDFSHDSVKEIQAPVHYLPTHLFRNFIRLSSANTVLLFRHPGRYGSALLIALKRFIRTRKIATFKHLLQGGYLTQNFLLPKTNIVHLHGHFAHSPTSVTYFASLLSGIPFSFTAHAKDIYTSNQEQLREKIHAASFIATCTRYNAEYLQKVAKNTTTPIHCIYHGIDTELFQSTGARKTCKPPYKLLTVARLTEKKGLPTLYRALARLQEQGLDFKHVLIGDGDDRASVLKLIEELDLKKRCQWLGTQTHKEVLNHFKKSDVFVLGSQIAKNGDRDGIPNVLVESLAMGVPAISTSVSAIPELIHHAETGLVVAPGSSAELADAIERLLQDSRLRQEIIDKGQELVEKEFNNKQLTEQLAALFHRQLNESTADKD